MILIFFPSFKGDKIHATIRKTLVNKYQDKFVDGGCYKICYMTVVPNLGSYRTTKHDSKLVKVLVTWGMVTCIVFLSLWTMYCFMFSLYVVISFLWDFFPCLWFCLLYTEQCEISLLWCLLLFFRGYLNDIYPIFHSVVDIWFPYS